MTELERRILIVEDQRIIAADLENTLGKLGYSVVGIATSGEGAVGMAEEHRPELVLMDIRLNGGMDGIEAAAIIRERWDVPVVYVTAYADEETIARAKVTTPFGYVVKPINERELRAAIEMALYKHDTERALAAERARRRAAEESQILIESIRDYAIMRLDPSGKVASWNAGVRRILGYEPGEIAGRHFSVFFPPGDSGIGDPDELLARAGREDRAEHEAWRAHKDGSRYWAHLTITALRDDHGLRGYAVFVRDLSERQTYEQALRESEQQFKATVVHAPVPMMLHAEDGEILAASEAVAHATGYMGEQIHSLDEWLNLAFGERAPEVRRLLGRVFRSGPPAPFELPVRLASGERRQWLFHVSEPLIVGAGRRGFVVVAVDVTEQRRAEEGLQESSRQKDEFIAMLGHELRNPLAAIRSATELLKLISKGDPKYQRAQGVLERQTGHMAKLIDGLLEVSRLISGRIAIDHEAVDVREVLEETIEDRVTQMEHRGLELRTDLDRQPIWVHGDRVRLAEVFDSLLSNAIKFTQPPGSITISAERHDSQAVVRVRDTGAGIEPSLLPYIFEPFRQAEQSLDRAAGGLGLGLAIVKGVVDLHGGTVAAESEPGHGTELTVRLPLSPAPEEEPAEDHAGVGWPARVLVVEDNEDAADTLRLVLETIGNEVEVAYDGESALEATRRFQPEVILCDIGLPGGMNGYDVARALRERGSTAFLVAVTGYGRPEDIRRADEVGFDAHLTKPIAVAAIEDLLATRRDGGSDGRV